MLDVKPSASIAGSRAIQARAMRAAHEAADVDTLGAAIASAAPRIARA